MPGVTTKPELHPTAQLTDEQSGVVATTKDGEIYGSLTEPMPSEEGGAQLSNVQTSVEEVSNPL